MEGLIDRDVYLINNFIEFVEINNKDLIKYKEKLIDGFCCHKEERYANGDLPLKESVEETFSSIKQNIKPQLKEIFNFSEVDLATITQNLLRKIQEQNNLLSYSTQLVFNQINLLQERLILKLTTKYFKNTV